MIRFTPIPTDTVRAYRAGAPDANGQTPERAISDGAGNPCRHCLRDIPEGEEMLVLAHRPFPSPQPYAEVGPLFLCAADCAPWSRAATPEIFTASDTMLIRGYGADDRIVYGTGQVVPSARIEATAEALLDRDDVAYLHLRSARNNCFQARIDRA